MHEVRGNILRDIIDILDGRKSPEGFTAIKDCTFDFMANSNPDNKVVISFTDGVTTITSIEVVSYEIKDKTIIFHGENGEIARVISTITPKENLDTRYFISEDEVKYIHEMMIENGEQYYSSPSGWDLVYDDRGVVMCFNGIEFPINHMTIYGRYIFFESNKDSKYNHIMMSRSAKCPF